MDEGANNRIGHEKFIRKKFGLEGDEKENMVLDRPPKQPK